MPIAPNRSLAAIGAAFALAALPAFAQAQDTPATGLEAAVDNPARAQANIERDADRHPADVLALLDLQPGDVVLDWFAGGGYWSEVLSGAVGADGVVYAQNARGEFAEFGNLEPLPMERNADIPLDDGSVDLVLLSYVYHHMHYNEATGEGTPETTTALLNEFNRVLKPGGRIAVIEHLAKPGSSRAESNEWHRLPVAALDEDMSAHGFVFAAEDAGIYVNPDDTLDTNWNEAGMSGNVTGMARIYVKE